jgi:hypothetical protein
MICVRSSSVVRVAYTYLTKEVPTTAEEVQPVEEDKADEGTFSQLTEIALATKESD